MNTEGRETNCVQKDRKTNRVTCRGTSFLKEKGGKVLKTFYFNNKYFVTNIR